jgi:nucleoside-diphosphate-sugar epimerase
MHVLIAGAGDLGMRLRAALIAKGASVTAISRSGGAGRVALDLLDRIALAPQVAAADALIFTAAPSERGELAYKKLYIDALANVLAARQTQPLLFCASTAVYSEDSGGWVDETSATQPSLYNGQILCASENLLRAGDCALRLGGLYGPGRNYACQQALSGTIASSQHWTNRIHLDDASAALQLLLARADRPMQINVVDDNPCTQQEQYSWLRSQAGLAEIAGRADAPSGKRVSNQRLRALGFVCRYPSFKEGYAQTL